MPQLHCYVPKEVAEELRRRARSEGTSVSGFLGALVRREVGAQDWPEGYFERVVGGWQGEPLERPPQPSPEVREAL
jgi:hypothetical protein